MSEGIISQDLPVSSTNHSGVDAKLVKLIVIKRGVWSYMYLVFLVVMEIG